MGDKLRGGTTIGGNIAYHAGNMGSGSNLDADKLDGQEGSYYATADSVAALAALDPVITLNGGVSGSGTMTNLGSTTIATVVANDSHTHSGSTITGITTATANTVVQRDGNGYVYANAFNSTLADTTTAATHYLVETGSDGWIRPKTLANVKAEIVTTAAVNSAALTSTGTVTSGIWSGGFGAVSGANLTTLNASNLSSGVVPDARISGSYTGMTNLTGTGTVDFNKFYGNAADTVTAPSFSWTTDPNTGIYSPAADQLAVTTGGVQRALFSSAGITGALVGNASTATKLQTARTISLSGDSTGSVTFDGSANTNIVVTRSTANMLSDILAVDGAGSGIDADLLDGQHGSYYGTAAAVALNTAKVSNVSTNLSYTTAATTGTVVSSDGTNATIPAATTALAGLMTNVDKTKLDGIASGAQVNVATNLSVTNGTTAGPTINSSTGTNVVIPTASATASGVVTTTTQPIAGVKTFTSSPIVPVPTTDFQSVPLRSTNITVNVGAGQTYTTINQALEYLSGFYPMYKKSGVTATINLKAGFVMAEQVLVSGIDLGWVTIVGEDTETIITHTALTTSFNDTHYPAFGIGKGGTSPVIGQLFRFNVQKVGGNKHGLMTWGAGSSANVLSGKGFIGVGSIGIYADYASVINANGVNVSGAGSHGIASSGSSLINANNANCSNGGSSGLSATHGSTINAYGVNASGAGGVGIYAGTCSIINAYGAIVQNQTIGGARIAVITGSHIEAHGINTTGGTVPAFSQTVNILTSNGIIYQ